MNDTIKGNMVNSIERYLGIAHQADRPEDGDDVEKYEAWVQEMVIDSSDPFMQHIAGIIN